MSGYKGWLPEEDEVVLRPIGLGEAAAILGRTLQSVRARRARLRQSGRTNDPAEPVGWPVPAMGFGESLACVQLRRWARDVEPANNLTWRIRA